MNEEVLPDVGKETLEKYNIKVPVWQSAVHRWLGAVNIKRDWYMQNYYNDNHQSPLVLKQARLTL
jgi:hypothetical protein